MKKVNFLSIYMCTYYLERREEKRRLQTEEYTQNYKFETLKGETKQKAQK